METTLAPSNGAFTFDPASHRYYWDGAEVLHVTGILHAAGLTPDYGGFHEAQWRGLHVHQACEWLDLNDLDWTTVYPQWVGYVRSYERRKQAEGWIPRLIEWQGYHPTLRFAGTLDREYEPVDGVVPQLDLKTGAEEDWHRWQTAGYYLLRGVKEARRGCLYLHEDGQPATLRWHDDPADMRVFLAALTIAHTKQGVQR